MNIQRKGVNVAYELQTLFRQMGNKPKQGLTPPLSGTQAVPAFLVQSAEFQKNVPNEVVNGFANDLTRLKLSINNSTTSDEAGKLLDEFVATYAKYEEQGAFADDMHHVSSNQLLQNSLLDVVDEVHAKFAQAHLEQTKKEWQAQSRMTNYLTKALDIQGTIEYSADNVARMMQQYEEKLRDGSLQPNGDTLFDSEAFAAFREKTKKAIDEAMHERSAYQTLIEKLAIFKRNITESL